MFRVKSITLPLAFIPVMGLPMLSQADQNSNRMVSGGGTIAFLSIGVLLPFVQDGSLGSNHALRALDSLLLAGGFAEGLSRLTREPRPNNPNKHDSFPSTHAATAFAIAAMQSQYHPNEAPLWFAGASIIGLSRVQLREHHWGDVLAGAAIGFTTARIELSTPRGILVSPFVGEEGYGVMVAARF